MITTSATTGAPDPDTACLPDLLDEQVHVDPHAVAVIHGPERITRRALADRAKALAAHLRALGTGPDDCVGLFAEPSAALVVGAWGILYASAAYLPLAPDYPDERLRYMATDARLRTIVAQDELIDRLSDLVPPGTHLVPLSTANDPHPPDGPYHRPGPRDLAYVIYTSGSTGKPKGVMIEHRSIVSQLRWLHATYRIGEAVILQKTPMSFDAAQWEILAPACGSTVAAGTPGLHRDAEGIIDAVRRHQVTALQCVPTLLRALIDTERLGTCTSLRQIFTGGEALSTSLAGDCLKAHSARLVNLYGPTECTINSSSFAVEPGALDDEAQSVPIGRPVTGTHYVIIGPDKEPVTAGAVGELHIGGVQLARGYLHRPALTAQRFVTDPTTRERLYRTGDLAAWNDDGTARFVGRVDNQVKLRGFRIELDEVRLAVEAHQWVRHAGLLVRDDPRTQQPHLLAFVELNPREAALMDQGRHGAHHQSKESRLQVRAQLSHAGVRTPEELAGRPVLALPGAEPTQEQVRRVFARKTYRFYEGPPVSRAALLNLLRPLQQPHTPRRLDQIELSTFGEIMRYLGQFVSDERLLPKFGYASPGALNATQLYLEIHHLWGQPSGYYYYHPIAHELVLIRELAAGPEPKVGLHFVGRRHAIEPVYKNNIREVLEIETGHMVGMLEQILPEYGLAVTAAKHTPQLMRHLDCTTDDLYLGSFTLTPHAPAPRDEIDVYVQVHPDHDVDLPPGQYAYRDDELTRIDDALVLRHHVIAINQQVYDRASIGISLISTTSTRWRRYIDLGRVLQRLSMNDLGFGFMSSGYSSESGHDLPSAHRIRSILHRCGQPSGPSYFAVGGLVSQDQVASRGMKEDAVHMKGPAELIRDELAERLPDYMIPNKVIIVDRMPLTANGKTDLAALAATAAATATQTGPPFVTPRTDMERQIAQLWGEATRQDAVSIHDDFFACGGNSLMAVALINRLNREFAASLPLQVIFQCPTVAQLASRLEDRDQVNRSRLVPLATTGAGRPVYCWPGLGGYPMNLRPLATRAGRPFLGVQAYGVNAGEDPYRTITRMAAEDVRAIRERQPHGPYTLWGYSFGSRVAYEAAYQLEQAGQQVDQLVLIAPGSPRLRAVANQPGEDVASFDNRRYLAVLFSVFAGTATGPLVDECLTTVVDEDTFTRFVHRHFGGLDLPLVRRITRVVARTYGLRHTDVEIARRPINAPVTVLRTRGDEDSFLDTDAARRSLAPTVVDLTADHYSVLREPGADELIAALPVPSGRQVRPHVSITHLQVALTDEQHSRLVAAVTQAMTRAFGCDEESVSIALEAVADE
ncbi:amino acid adenylation domain-containing protein [Micromonospora mangrovi]|uniref:Amino acid adenylation domain-containing protein n=2 Tax=Micromonospora TaxID=1873 RepID=A0AAU8HJK4_9ACTN